MAKTRFPEMSPNDWQQSRETIRKYIDAFHKPLEFSIYLICLAVFVFGWWVFGIVSFAAGIGAVVVAWAIHRWFQRHAIIKALFAGYEMGFEAGQLAAKGISMKQYTDHLQSMSEIS